AVAGHDLVGHAEVETAVGDELVELLEGTWIEQEVDPLAGGEPAGLVLAAQPLLAAAELGPALEVRERVVGGHPPTLSPRAPSPVPSGISRGRCWSGGGCRAPRSPPADRCRCRRQGAPPPRCAWDDGSSPPALRS